MQLLLLGFVLTSVAVAGSAYVARLAPKAPRSAPELEAAMVAGPAVELVATELLAAPGGVTSEALLAYVRSRGLAQATVVDARHTPVAVVDTRRGTVTMLERLVPPPGGAATAPAADPPATLEPSVKAEAADPAAVGGALPTLDAAAPRPSTEPEAARPGVPPPPQAGAPATSPGAREDRGSSPGLDSAAEASP
jgi:hypothetical protein